MPGAFFGGDRRIKVGRSSCLTRLLLQRQRGPGESAWRPSLISNSSPGLKHPAAGVGLLPYQQIAIELNLVVKLSLRSPPCRTL